MAHTIARWAGSGWGIGYAITDISHRAAQPPNTFCGH